MFQTIMFQTNMFQTNVLQRINKYASTTYCFQLKFLFKYCLAEYWKHAQEHPILVRAIQAKLAQRHCLAEHQEHAQEHPTLVMAIQAKNAQRHCQLISKPNNQPSCGCLWLFLVVAIGGCFWL